MKSVKRHLWHETYLNDEPDVDNIWQTLQAIDTLCYSCTIEIRDKIYGH